MRIRKLIVEYIPTDRTMKKLYTEPTKSWERDKYQIKNRHQKGTLGKAPESNTRPSICEATSLTPEPPIDWTQNLSRHLS